MAAPRLWRSLPWTIRCGHCSSCTACTPRISETRVRRAAARLTPHLGVHGLRLEVEQVAGGIARLRVLPGNGAVPTPALLLTLPMEIESAIVEAAPDLDEVVIDGLDVLGGAATASAVRA